MNPTVATDATIPRAKYLARGITKRFGANLALDHVNLELEAGEVHALIGENGAGKSTLLKILSGAERPDEGELLLDGEPINLRNVAHARSAGVSIVFQELELFDSLTVLANLFFGREPRHGGTLIDRGEMVKAAEPLLARVGLSVSVDTLVERLSLEQRQLLEIAKALGTEARVLILDEPTSALNLTATARLFEIIRDCRDSGAAVVFVSHRLEEVLGIADRITVLRDGHVISTRPRAETAMDTLVSEMIGRSPRRISRRQAAESTDATRLRTANLTITGRVTDVNISVGPTEIVGLAGLEGAGHEAVIDAIFGITKPSSGEITLPDGQRGPRSIHAAVAAGVAYVPADRRHDGLMLEQSVATNAAHVVTGVLGRTGRFVHPRDLVRRANELAAEVKLSGARVTDPVGALSGGNQQKVLISRWLAANPRVLLLNDPTRGVDVGAKAEIYELIARAADQGKHVIFSSTELAEYGYLCHRVYVFYRGAVTYELSGTQINEHNLLSAINTGFSPLSAANLAS